MVKGFPLALIFPCPMREVELSRGLLLPKTGRNISYPLLLMCSVSSLAIMCSGPQPTKFGTHNCLEQNLEITAQSLVVAFEPDYQVPWLVTLEFSGCKLC